MLEGGGGGGAVGVAVAVAGVGGGCGFHLSLAPDVVVDLHPPVQAERRDPPAEHVARRRGIALARQLLAHLHLAQHVVPHVDVRHAAHEGVRVGDPQEAVLVLAQDEHAARADGVAVPQVLLLLAQQPVDPQLGHARVRGPRDAVVDPVGRLEAGVRQVDKLVADPQAHLVAHVDHELVVHAGAGVGHDRVHGARVEPHVHAGGEGVQVHGVDQAGQGVAAGVALREVEDEGGGGLGF